MTRVCNSDAAGSLFKNNSTFLTAFVLGGAVGQQGRAILMPFPDEGGTNTIVAFSGDRFSFFLRLMLPQNFQFLKYHIWVTHFNMLLLLDDRFVLVK